ncbi:MAG: extracellular solute-binding protein [Lachnospiraceae bacterium]|jgi:ABC-type glycerol-3-phosphate transport system substrate-binding protein|nr:extracellular solute-binding protein [Lachnospiraceae bacterium]
MKVKKHILYFMCAILFSCIFLSCSENKQQGEENQGTEIHDPEQAEITQKPEVSPVSEDFQDGENVVDVRFPVLENYIEKNIPSVYDGHEKEHYCNVVLNEKKEIEYYTMEEKEDGYDIQKYTLTGDGRKNPYVWVREEVSWLKGIKNKVHDDRITVFLGEDSKTYAWYIDSEENVHIVKQSNDTFVELPKMDLHRTDFQQIAVLENGNIVSADMGKECFVYQQEDGSLLTSFPCGWYESLRVSGNQIYITDRTSSYVQNYNAEQQVFETPIALEIDNSVRIFSDEDDVYLGCPKGIFRTKKGGEEFQKILDAGTYHFARENIILLKFFVCGDAFYFVYGEDGGSIKKYVPAEEGDEPDQSLTVYSLQNNDVILDMISEFQNKYPDIEIIYETGEGAEGSVTIADRIRALNARILAGDGPDVFVLDGLPTESYIKKGILADLMPTLADRKEDLVPGILSAYTTEEKVYMLPLRFSVPVFVTSGQESSVYSTLEALVEYSEENNGIMQGGYSYADLVEMLYYNYRPDMISKDGVVKKESLKIFLEQTKRFCESEGISGTTDHSRTYLQGYSGANDLLYGNAKFMFVLVNGGSELAELPSIVKYKNGEIVGNNGVFFPSAMLGVNSMSKKKDLAYLFFQFAISNEVQKRHIFFSGYPIDVKVLDKFANTDLSHIVVAGGNNGELDFSYFTKEESAQMIGIAKNVSTPFTVNASVWQIIENESVEYLKGEKGLEECVDVIASRVQLYLYEE